MNARIPVVAAVTIIVGILIGATGVFAPENIQETDRMASMSDMSQGMEMRDVTIGHIVPLSGDLAQTGTASKISMDFAVTDYNEYLATLGADWRISVIHEDSQSNPVTALEKLTTLKARSVDVIIGPYASANVRALLGYAESNNMILISPSSTAPQLAIPNDAVFRLISDDNQQALALTRLMSDSGINRMATIQRGDAWGDGLYTATSEAFARENGVADESIRYNPELSEFAVSVSLLADNIATHIEEGGASDVAVLTIGFAETLEVIQEAASYDILDDVQWLCTDAFATDSNLLDDSIALEFAVASDLKCTQAAVYEHPRQLDLKSRLVDTLGRTPNTYAYSAYDSLWVVANTILETGDTDAQKIRDAIIGVANHHNGMTGSTMLNEAGDLDSSFYAIWEIEDDQWVVGAHYVGSQDKIIQVQ